MIPKSTPCALPVWNGLIPSTFPAPNELVSGSKFRSSGKFTALNHRFLPVNVMEAEPNGVLLSNDLGSSYPSEISLSRMVVASKTENSCAPAEPNVLINHQ